MEPLIFVAWLLCAIIGAAIGSPANMAGTGLILGLLFGPIGLIIIAIMANGRQKTDPDTTSKGDPKSHPPSGMSYHSFRQYLIKKVPADKHRTDEWFDAKYREYQEATKEQELNPTSTSQNGENTAARLKKAKELLDQGHLTNEEYEDTRQRIIKEL